MKKMTIMRGVSGSGKSTYACAIPDPKAICSADHYFEGPEGYAFDPSKLVDAHASCYKEAYQAMSDGVLHVVVDNTNMRRAEYTPYVMLAGLFGYEVEMVHVSAPLEVCVARTVHGVPPGAIKRQLHSFEERAFFDPPQIEVGDSEEVEDAEEAAG